MNWIEWIEVQTTHLPETTMRYMLGLTKELAGIPGLVSIELYTHAVISGNIAAILLWESDPPQPRGSLAGLQLAGELKKIGLVAHAVWVCKKDSFAVHET